MHQSDLTGEVVESIRAHRASGYFTTDEATSRLRADGMSADEAAALLAQPVPGEWFDRYKTYPKER